MKKRNLTFILVLAGILSAFISVHAFASDGLIYFSDPIIEAGNNVEVEMTVQCDTEKIGEVNILLKYPSEDLVFTDGTAASGGAGTIRVHGKGTNTENGKYVFTLNFATKNQGEYSVTVDSQEVYSETGALITITHQGSSTITVTASTTLNKDALLSSLEVRPGTLIPAFDPSIANYNITVGLSVDRLTINANPSDSGFKVSVENNEALKEGENDVIIYVRSEDGTKQSEYHINVLKTEGGEENVTTESESTQEIDTSTGVQLSCKGKSITIMDPPSEAVVPEGFRESTIKIDGQPVTGWITGDSENPEYFLVYGMNDEGELSFYRYDRKEKTIQRFFEDTAAIDVTNTEDYLALNSKYEELQKSMETRTMIISIVGIVALLLIGILIYLAIRLGSVSRELELIRERAGRKNSERSLDPGKSKRSRHAENTESLSDSTIVIKHSTTELFSETEKEPESNQLETDIDENNPSAQLETGIEETKILNSRERRKSRRAGGVSDETTVIRRESRRHRDT